MIDFDSIEHEIINDLSYNLITTYLIINNSNNLPKEVNLHIIKFMINVSEEMKILEEDKDVILFRELLFLKTLSMSVGEELNLSKYGLPNILDYKFTLILKYTLYSLKYENQAVNNDIVPNVSLKDYQITSDIKFMMTNKFNEYKRNEKLAKIIDDFTITSINKIKTHKKYLTKYNWLFLLQDIICESCSNRK